MVKLNEEKSYLDEQRVINSMEFKKLFSVNAELERQIADYKLQVQSFHESKEKFFHRDQTRFEALSVHSTAQEKMHMAKIQEV